MRKLADVARAVLLAATVLAGLVAWLFAARPQWIDALDDRIVRAHTGWAEAALARAAREGLAPADRIAELRALLADLADVRKGERRAPIRREAARLLARCQLEAGDAAGAQRTAAQWLAFDPLDVDARLALHAALAAQPERRQDAAALARDLFALAPDQEHLLLPHLRACLAAGDEAAAAQAFVAHLAAGGTPAGEPVDRGFVLQRDDGDGFEPLRAEPLQIERAGDRLALSFAPPLGTRRLRLQFPPRAAFTWHDVRIRVATAAGTQEVALPDLARLTAGPVGLQGVRMVGGALVVAGSEDAWMWWTLGPGAGIETRWTVYGRVADAPAAWLAEVLALPAVGRAARALLSGTAVEDERARLRMRAARRAVLAQGLVTVRAGGGEPARAPLVVDEHGASFSVRVERGPGDVLAVELPAVAGLEVALRAPRDAVTLLRPGPDARIEDGRIVVEPANGVLVFALAPDERGPVLVEGTLR